MEAKTWLIRDMAEKWQVTTYLSPPLNIKGWASFYSPPY